MECREMTGPRAIGHQRVRIGRHREAPRIWLEGRKLDRGNIRPGDRFTVVWNPEDGLVELVFSDEGDRVVSRRQRHGRDMPVIDIGGERLAQSLGGAERVRVKIGRGRIVVTMHPDDAASAEREARLAAKLADGVPLAVGSIAHGGGILDHALHWGLESAGVPVRLAFAIENDPATLDAAAMLNGCWDDDTVHVEASLDEVDASDLPQVDVLVAGLPCVGASVAGKAKNGIAEAEEHKEAGHLFVAFLHLVKALNPSVVVIENVLGFARSSSATVIRKMLEVRGYAIRETEIDGNAFGALEMRVRWCLVASPPGLALDPSRATPSRVKEGRLGDILEDVAADDPSWRSIEHMHEKASRDKEKGSNFSVSVADPDDAAVRSMGASYWRRRPTEPKLMHPTKPNHARLLTPLEHARAKTVPPALVEGLSGTMAHQILGNSVIHTAWEAVGKALGEGLRAA